MDDKYSQLSIEVPMPDVPEEWRQKMEEASKMRDFRIPFEVLPKSEETLRKIEEQSKLEDGYYWVRSTEDSEWEVAKRDGCWCFHGLDDDWDWVHEVGPKVERPPNATS